MPNQTKIKLNSVDITIDHKENTVRLFDWSAMEQVMFYASDWREIKSAIDSQLGGIEPQTKTANKHSLTSYGLVPVCQKCEKPFAAYEKDDEGFVCRSCRLPKTKNGYTTSTMHVSNINIEDMQNLIKK